MQVSPHPTHLGYVTPDWFTNSADTGRLELCDDENGDPALRVTERTLSDRILSALSYVPIINQWEPVYAFTKDIEAKNAQVLGLFLRSLPNQSHMLQNDDVVTHLQTAATRIVAHAGATPLQHHVFDRLVNIATPERKMCGFSNFGNTCYANTGLKFLVHSIGRDRLLTHLEALKNTNDEKKKDSAEKFINLIDAAYSSDKPVQKELNALLKSLQQHPNFNGKPGFTIIGEQNDTQEFLAKLGECFDLGGLNENSLMMQTTLINGEEKRDPKISSPNFATDVNLISGEDANLDLQGIINKVLTSETEREIRWNTDDAENTKVKVQNEWVTPHVDKLKRLNLHLNAMDFDLKTGEQQRLFLNADFTKPVTITVREKSSGGTRWQLTLEPKDIIVHDSDLSHYYMYTRDKQNSWTEHNDARVTSDIKQIPAVTQAKMISFEVTDRKILDHGQKTLPPLHVPFKPQALARA